MAMEMPAASHTRALVGFSCAGSRNENSTIRPSTAANAITYGSSRRAPGAPAPSSRFAARRFHQYTDPPAIDTDLRGSIASSRSIEDRFGASHERARVEPVSDRARQAGLRRVGVRRAPGLRQAARGHGGGRQLRLLRRPPRAYPRVDQ